MREGRMLTSVELPERLASESVIEQLRLHESSGRLEYRLITGSGPATGWVSLAAKGKDLIVRKSLPGEVVVQATDAAPLVPVGDGVYEFVMAQSDECHDKVFNFISRACKKKDLKSKTEELEAKFKAGDLPPCVYKRRMAVVQLSTGGVVVYSPVECLPELQAAIAVLGGLKALVLPNSEHAVHAAAWMAAFPDVPIIAPGGDAMKGFLEAFPSTLVLSPGGPFPEMASQILSPGEFHVEVVITAGFQEVCLLHRRSRTFIACDFLYFGSEERKDSTGWKMLAADEWRELYHKAYCCINEDVLLPVYRTVLDKDQRKLVAASLQRILAWRPERVMSAHGGKISEGGATRTKKLLEASWGWCKA